MSRTRLGERGGRQGCELAGRIMSFYLLVAMLSGCGEGTYGSRGSKGLENAVRPAALGQPSMRGSSSARNPSMWSKDLGTQREGIRK